MRRANKKERKLFQTILDDYLFRNQIGVIRYHYQNNGYAILDIKKISIPYPTNLLRFSIGIHEIAHCIIDKKSYPAWKSEYICERYTQDLLIKYHLDWHEDYHLIVAKMKRYVLMKLCQAINRGLYKSALPDDLIEWLGFNHPNQESIFDEMFILRDSGYRVFASDQKIAAYGDIIVVWHYETKQWLNIYQKGTQL